MTEEDSPVSAEDRLFRESLHARNFEIQLLWQRGAFFWAFNAVAFAGFSVAASEDEPVLAVLIACFGLFSSVC